MNEKKEITLSLCDYRLSYDKTIGTYSDMDILSEAAFNSIIDYILETYKPFDVVTIFDFPYRNGMHLYSMKNQYGYMDVGTYVDRNYDAIFRYCEFSGLVARIAKKYGRYDYLARLKQQREIHIKDFAVDANRLEDMKFLIEEFPGVFTISANRFEYDSWENHGCTSGLNVESELSD